MNNDYFNQDASGLIDKKLFLLDMDGTIYEEERVFDGTLELLEQIEQNGGRYVFITNNSSKSVMDYLSKVRKMGIRADKDNFFTSAQATMLYLTQKYNGKKVYCQGTDSLINELRNAGICVTTELDMDADIVLVGFDTELTSAKLRNTCELLSVKDVPFIATNPDLRCPVAFGYIPDCGSICNMITVATGKAPTYIGKPEPTMINIVMEKFGYEAKDTVVVGDRLYTDVASGLNAGVTAICVLSGEATVKDIEEGDIKPTYTFNSVRDIWQIIKEHRDEKC